MTREVLQLAQMIRDASNIVFFGGAGVSTASGIPDFRSAHGLYNGPEGKTYEEMLSIGYFTQYPDAFWKFYRNVMLYPDAKPNAAHYALARLEKQGRLKAVLTQNIDGLHREAGSLRVLELHGSVYRNRCMKCGKFYTLQDVLEGENAPRCTDVKGKPCSGLIKPEVVLYGEALNEDVLDEAIRSVRSCDLLIVGGTSLMVHPAAGLIGYLKPSAKLVLINRDSTPYDDRADLVIREDIAEVLDQAVPGNEG